MSIKRVSDLTPLSESDIEENKISCLGRSLIEISYPCESNSNQNFQWISKNTTIDQIKRFAIDGVTKSNFVLSGDKSFDGDINALCDLYVNGFLYTNNISGSQLSIHSTADIISTDITNPKSIVNFETMSSYISSILGGYFWRTTQHIEPFSVVNVDHRMTNDIYEEWALAGSIVELSCRKELSSTVFELSSQLRWKGDPSITDPEDTWYYTLCGDAQNGSLSLILPHFNGFIQGGDNNMISSSFIQEGLPSLSGRYNITGLTVNSSGSHSHTMKLTTPVWSKGNHDPDGSSWGHACTTTVTTNKTGSHTHTLGGTATLTKTGNDDSIYGKSQHVQPKSMKMFTYIYVGKKDL